MQGTAVTCGHLRPFPRLCNEAHFALHICGGRNFRKCVIRPEKDCDAVNQQPAVAKGHIMFGVRFTHMLRC